MSTREQIIKVADGFIRNKGFNAFSFYDISKEIGIKNASIHYHFATKTDLACAVIEEYINKVELIREDSADKGSMQRLKTFISVYTSSKEENKVCLVGSLAPDLYTLEKPVRKKLNMLASLILDWVTEILKEGKANHVFQFDMPARTKALMIITNLLASLQLTRLTGDNDFKIIKSTIIKELKIK